MDRFENMNTFIRVVETGGISTAARRLGTAKSVVSRRLKELEAHLGVELFHRTTRKMTLTDTGQAFYTRCVRLLDDVMEAELATAKTHGSLSGRLKVALPSSFGVMHLGPAINEFLQRHPHIEFDLDFNDRQVDLIQEGFDLAIRIATLADSSLIARHLAPIQHVLCASPDYLAHHGAPESPAELAGHRCLVYSLSSDDKLWTFTDAQQQVHRLRITPHILASAGEYLRDAAVNGEGVTFLPTFIVYREIRDGRLLALLNNYTHWQTHAYAVYPHTRHLSQRVRAFVDFLAERFAGTPYWDSVD